jgi:peptide/nickel transport system permease protein
LRGRAVKGRSAGVVVVPFLRHPVTRVVVRRLLLAIPLLFAVSILSFLLLSLAPGNAALEILGNAATPARVRAVERQLGLNLPLWTQYWHWLLHALQGDLGTSIFSGEPVTQAIVQRLPVTLSLIIGGLIVMPGIGITLGVYSAVHGGAVGRFVDGFALVGFALPSFWLGAILIEFFAVKLHLFPAVGYVPIATSPSQWLRSITLPVIALSVGGIAGFSKYAREAMLEVLASEHIRMARADGIPKRWIYFRYALKNTGLRMLTLIGLLLIGLLGGTAFIETIFALPGLGAYAVQGAQRQDVPVVEGVTVFFTLLIILINLVTDLAYTWLDPRVRSS